MNKIVEFYGAAVCFFTTACFAITLGLFLQQIVRISLPAITSSSFKETGLDVEASKHDLAQAAQDAEETQRAQTAKIDHVAQVKRTRKTPEQIEKSWEADYRKNLQQERRDALQSSINYLIILLVDILIFVPHWRIIRKKKA